MTDRDHAEQGGSMTAVVTTGVGGYERLAVTQLPVPVPGEGKVLLQVLAAGVNNTDINTRTGWYGDGGWNARTPFPLIQGADACARVVCVGPGAGTGTAVVGSQVLVRPCCTSAESGESRWLGSDSDGAFAQYLVVPRSEVFPVRSGWSDAELATIPCAYGTAENMLERAGVTGGQRVLVTGASGGVGSAAVQLAVRRGAEVVAVAGPAKQNRVRTLGATTVLGRDDDPRTAVGARSVDVIVDNVAGDGFPALLEVLVRGGTYVTSGAIAGAQVALDLRTLYLNDLRLLGCTGWEESVFANLVSYIEKDEIRPLLAGTFPLRDIEAAQRQFLTKEHVGSYVLIP
ncbi:MULTISPECIES: zinc-binding dehydrogenase [Nocardiaceae]|uniref:NADPH:quinone reductase-like Zn-dependent oxidoreductase n=1 Tax=Rhodococcoides corynebacterioides TaxID=53972 RepID=A0ABS2KUE8_9NOCA|nr:MULTISPECIES: zinc-binding dehydrogenase [Rhodococcus]MBM7415575.1 NADPH:quinone reductase-like Zn-dependent oxidoreductase [Rhodococcus corynebacterioides]MBP1118037.1 NADPH:quinone reductase-like Zn-dependent oxidoreductase [Rhodococcus sp. PvP016]